MFPKSRKKDLVVQEMGDELMVYDMITNKAICLNKTSAFVWQNCDGNRDISQLVKLIKKEFGSSVDEDFVWLALDQLKKENLIDTNIPKSFNGMSRRDVIKRVGLGTMVALPIVTGLIAPTAAHAGSPVCNAQCQCTVNALPTAGVICQDAVCAAGCECEVVAVTVLGGVCNLVNPQDPASLIQCQGNCVAA